MSYVTLAELKAWIGVDDETDDALVEPTLIATERVIDQACGRHFSLETAATRVAYPNAEGSVDVVDLISITTLKQDTNGTRQYSTTFATSDYELLPYADEAGRPSVRYQQIHIWPTSSLAFTQGRLVQIVGDFGYVDENDNTPYDVQLACKMLAARFWKRHETPLGILGTTDLGQFQRLSAEDPDVAALLLPYKRTASWVLV